MILPSYPLRAFRGENTGKLLKLPTWPAASVDFVSIQPRLSCWAALVYLWFAGCADEEEYKKVKKTKTIVYLEDNR